MRAVFFRSQKAGVIWLPLLAILVLLAIGFAAVRLVGKDTIVEKGDVEKIGVPAKEPLSVELAPGKPNSLMVPEDVCVSLGIRKGDVEQIAVVRKPTRTRPLAMPGSTALDPSRLIRVRVRFAPAEVVEIGKINDPHSSPGFNPPLRRDLQPGDAVKKGDLLAVLHSIDVGNKKNDLFDAISQLQLDKEVLCRAESHSDAVPEVFLLNARRNVQADSNAVLRAENTLKTWGIPENDIQTVRDEVKNSSSPKDQHSVDKQRAKRWARVELRAAGDGFIVEQNIALHETIVDNTTNLFQIANVDPLIVLASVPEDDLPSLQTLKNQMQENISWTVQTVGAKPIVGFIDDIGYLIDPNQHTAVVRGHIPNPNGVLRAGQFVTATVDLLPPQGVVEVPISAIVEDGRESIVFVQPDPKKRIFTMRRVQVTNRFDRTAYVRSVPTKPSEELLHDDSASSSLPLSPLHEGERVLTAGSLELKTALADKTSGGARD